MDSGQKLCCVYMSFLSNQTLGGVNFFNFISIISLKYFILTRHTRIPWYMIDFIVFLIIL